MSEIRFAIVVDGEVAGTFHFDSEGKDSVQPAMIAALQSDPKIVEDLSVSVKRGWTYDGTSFIEPTE